MERFVARYRSLVTGVLSGFDRLVFRGWLLPLMRDGGMYFFLEAAGVRPFILHFSSALTPISYLGALPRKTRSGIPRSLRVSFCRSVNCGRKTWMMVSPRSRTCCSA